MPPVLENTSANATANFANSMRDALNATPVETIIAPPPTIPEPPKPDDSKPVAAVSEPAVKVDEKPAATSQTTDEPDLEKWPRTAEEWKKWNKVRKTEYEKRDKEIETWKGKATELETKLKETPAVNPEFETVKKERDQYGEVLKNLAVEHHPKFKAYYDNKTSAQVEIAKRVVGVEKSEQITKILSLPDGDFKDRQVEELVADMPPIKQAQIGSAINALAEINNEKVREITKARENFDTLRVEQENKQKAVRTQLETAFNDTVTKLKSSNPLYKIKDGDDTWNKGVQERIDTAKHYLMGNPKPEQIIEAATNAASYKALVENQIEVLKENESLKSQIKSLSSATPTITTERPAAAEGLNGAKATSVVVPSSGRPMDAVAPWVKSLGVLGGQQ